MSIRIRALCTKSIAALSPEDLRAGVAERLPALAVYYGKPDPAADVARLRVEGDPAPGLASHRLHHRVEADRFVPIERWADAARVRREIEQLRASLEGCEEEEVEDVLAFLDDVVEIVALELGPRDAEGMGWPVAIAAAACVAARGEGLVQADGEGWMKPSGRAVEQVLDAD
jgi:hypothetical protein